MAEVQTRELVDRFEQFFRSYYREAIGSLAQAYPNEQRSLAVDWQDLYRFDPDLADDYLAQPDQLRRYAEEALRVFDLPVDVSLGRAHVRVFDLPETTEIRAIRARDVNRLVSVQGIVRKATDVRPKIEEAAFECQRCGTLTYIPQAGGFQEPHECQGCERQGPFSINYDQSTFVDAQKLRVQERPEGLRGGETPQSIDIHFEDDVTGRATPGDHITATGALRIEQQQRGNQKSRVFDVYMEGHSIEVQDEEFESMDITDEDKQRIIELSDDDDLYGRMVDSVAPSIYGFDEEKLAMTLQLFSGITKHLPDESRIRGDLHILLIGDPGTGKCVTGDTRVTLADGSEVEIGDFVEAHLTDPIPVDDGVFQEVDVDVQSVGVDGEITTQPATRAWKREAPDRMIRIETASGTELEVTPTHPLFCQSDGRVEPVVADELSVGDFLAVPRRLDPRSNDDLETEYRLSRSHNAVRLDLPDRWTPWLARLIGFTVAEGYIEHRDDHTGFVSITNNDREVLDEVAASLDRLGLNHFERSPHGGKQAREIVCPSGEFVSFLGNLEPALLTGSADQRVPTQIMRASPGIRSAFLQGYIEGEGHVSTNERELTVSSMSKDLLEGVRSLLLSVGIRSQLKPHSNGSFRLRISGRDFIEYTGSIGFVTERKSVAAVSFDTVTENTNTDVVPDIGDELRRIRNRLHLSQFECGIPRTTYQHYERGDRNPSRERLRSVTEAFEDRLEWLRRTRGRLEGGHRVDVEKARHGLDLSQRDLADRMGLSQTAISYYERERAVPGGGRTAEAKAFAIERIDDALEVEDDVRALRRLADGDVAWDRVDSMEVVEPDSEWVYDLEVEGTHNYLANNVISHNSQLLQYIRHIAPRSVYTSGKGSSSAGLCVAGNTLVHTESGFRRIRDLAESHHPEPVNTDTSANESIGLYTFNRAETAVEMRPSSHVWRMPEKPCRRIETGHGKELEASVNTPILTCGQRGIEWKPISEIEPGDYVAVPRFSDIDRNSPDPQHFFEFTNEKLKLDEESLSFLRRQLYSRFGTLRDAAAELGLPEYVISDHLWNRYVPVDRLEMVLEAVDAEIGDVRVDRAMLRHGNTVRIPRTFDEDLMYLVGLVFGDGDISTSPRGGNPGTVRISNGDESLLRRGIEIIERAFDKQVEIEYQDDRVPSIRLNSATVARFFSHVGMRTPKADLALSEDLTCAEHVDSFLRGYMDADGSVSVRTEGGYSVLVSTISEELARQIQLVLETFGVRARVRERDRRGTCELANGQTIESKHPQYFVEMYGADVERYADAIGFESDAKRDALDRITDVRRRREEGIPLGAALGTVEGPAGRFRQNFNRGENTGRGRARSILDEIDLGRVAPLVEEAVESDLRWDEVVEAVDVGEKEVFDLTVPGTNNFIGNGVVTHNTAAAIRDDFGDGQQWTLEAGALVLADKGVAAIDELDKMRCVTGETLVQTVDDGLVPIAELARKESADGRVEPLANGRTIRDVDTAVFTMTEDGRIVPRPVSAVHEYEAPRDLIEVTLESGETLTATADHPFFVLEDGERSERPASDLAVGDWTYVPRGVPSPAADGGALLHGSGGRNCTDLGPAMGAVLGCLVGDGNITYDREAGVYGIRFTNKEDRLIEHFEASCEEAFGRCPVRYPSDVRDDGVTTTTLRGKAIVDAVLEIGANLETYDGKRLPGGVARGSRETKAAFVRALADSEGTVDTRCVKIASTSRVLLLGVKQLLLEFGISSQLQTRQRPEGRDLHNLVITAKPSLTAFEAHVGFELDRKQRSLETACDSVSGDRTIIDVIPGCGTALERVREGLRLYQSECGLVDATYCNFETGEANVSLHRAETVLGRFEERLDRLERDIEILDEPCRWERLDEIRERYHVSQREIAEGMGCSQPYISEHWGDRTLRGDVRRRLRGLLEVAAETDLQDVRRLVRGDVKWRRVSDVRRVRPGSKPDDRVPILRHRIAELLGIRDPDRAVEDAHDLLSEPVETGSWEELRGELERHRIPFEDVASELGVAGSTVSRWFSGDVRIGNFEPVRARCSDLVFDRRASIRRLLDEIEDRSGPARVYDLTVEGTHNFVANGLVVHNSEDRSAMHEALEQQSISISKAGINATLKSRCSLLGAANPKYGRFDQYEPIAEQIDLEPALISRFDLIFTVTDQPDAERDRELADHILRTNYAGELNTQRTSQRASSTTQEAVDEAAATVEPSIDPDLFRKYIAYAKRNVFPAMSDDAREAIRDFYVDLRAQGTEEDAPVPITARKLEALVRLAEASARVRLSDTVERADAERVIAIVRSSLRAIGVDPETGRFDADVIETGTSKTQRDRIKSLRSLIEEIETEFDDGAPVEEVVERAVELGMEASRVEHEIETLKQRGELYEPRTNHLRTT